VGYLQFTHTTINRRGYTPSAFQKKHDPLYVECGAPAPLLANAPPRRHIARLAPAVVLLCRVLHQVNREVVKVNACRGRLPQMNCRHIETEQDATLRQPTLQPHNFFFFSRAQVFDLLRLGM
jgi:hypothetical protein